MVVKKPKISVNKLAEFMTASPARQRQILKSMKYPTEFLGMYYREASDSISRVLANGLENLTPIANQKAVLEQTVTDKVGTQRRINSNIDALEGFEGMLDKVDFYGGTPSLGEHAPPKMTFFGVEVSVRPQILLKRDGKAGPLVGAMKMHFSRQFPFNAEDAGIVSAILQEWCKATMHDEGVANGELCPVIDVCSGEFFPGVKATAQRIKQVEAACQNIAALWPGIEP